MSTLFNTLGKKKSDDGIKLRQVTVADTPLADGSDYVFGAATPVLASLLPESEARRDEVRKELSEAGYYQPHATQNLAAIRYLCIILPMLALGALLLIVPRNLERIVLGAIIIVPAVCWSLPRLYLKGKAVERKSRIEKAIPDMLDMLNMCVSQGMTVPAAMKRVGVELKQPHPDLHQELAIVTHQAEVGTMQQALENFSRRVDLADVHSFTSLINQTERMGTGISKALAEYSENIRESLKQRADEKGNRAAFKLLFPTVLCLMPAVYMFLLGPAIVEFSNFMNRDDQTMQRANEIIQRTGQQRFTGNRGE